MTKPMKISSMGRRSELMAELFLQELEPEFVAQSTIPNFEFDFLVGFMNPQGGINTFAVEVKATERELTEGFSVRPKIYALLAHSNIPALLLVIDVKNNVFYYAWPSDNPEVSQLQDSVQVPIIRVSDETKKELVARMSGQKAVPTESRQVQVL